MYPDLIEIPSEHDPNLTGVFYNNKKIGSIAKGHGYISNDDYKNKQPYFKTYVYDGDEFFTLGYYKTHDEAINAIQKYHFPVYRGEKVTYSLSLQNDIRILKNDSVIGLVSKFDKFEGSDRPVYMAFSALPNEKGGGAKHLRKIGNFESFSQAVQAIINQNKPDTILSESKFSAEKVSDTMVKVTYDDTTIGTISIIFLNGKYRYVPYGLHINKNINQHFWTMLKPEGVLNQAIKNVLDWYKDRHNIKENHTDISESVPYINEGKIRAVKVNDRSTLHLDEIRIYDGEEWIGVIGVTENSSAYKHMSRYGPFAIVKDNGYGFHYLGGEEVLNVAIKKILDWHKQQDSSTDIAENANRYTTKTQEDIVRVYDNGIVIGYVRRPIDPEDNKTHYWAYLSLRDSDVFIGSHSTLNKAIKTIIIMHTPHNRDIIDENFGYSPYTAKKDTPNDTIIYKNGLEIGRIKKINEYSPNPSYMVFKNYAPNFERYPFEYQYDNYGAFETFAKAVQKLIELEPRYKYGKKSFTENTNESNKKSVDYRVVPTGKDSFGDKFDIFANNALIGRLTRLHASTAIHTKKQYNYDPIRLRSGIRSLPVGFKRHDSLKNAIKDVIDSYNEFRRIYKPYFFIDFIQSGVPGIIKTVHASDDEIGRFYKVGNLYRTYYNMDDYKPKENNFRKEIDAVLYLISRFLEHHNVDATINTNQLKKRLRDMNKQSKNKNIEESSQSDTQPKFRIERYPEDEDGVDYYVYKNNVIVGKIEYFKNTNFYYGCAFHLGSKIFDNLTDAIKMILDPTNKKWKEISRSQEEKLRRLNRITESKESSQSDTKPKFSVERWHENQFHIIYSVKRNSIEIGKIDYIKKLNCYYSKSLWATPIEESSKIFDNLTDAIKMILDPTNKKWKEISRSQAEKFGFMTESNKSNNDVAYTVKHISNTKSYLMANNKIIGELLRDIKGGKTHATGYYSKNTYTLPVWGKAAATWQTFDSLLDGVKFLIHRYKEFINNFNPQFLVEQYNNDIFVVKVASDDEYSHYNVFAQISCWFNYRTGKNKYTVYWQYNTVTKQRFTGNSLYDAVIVSIEKFLDRFKIKANIDYDGIKKQTDKLLSEPNQHKELTENSDESVKYTVYRTPPNKTLAYNPPYFVYANGREIGNVLAREEGNAYYARSYYTKDPKEYTINKSRHAVKEKEEFNKLTHAIKFIIDIYKNFREKFTVDLDLKQDQDFGYSYSVRANNHTIGTISTYSSNPKKIYYVYGLTDSPSIQHVRTIHDAVPNIVKLFKKDYDLTDEKIDYSKLNAKLEQLKND